MKAEEKEKISTMDQVEFTQFVAEKKSDLDGFKERKKRNLVAEPHSRPEGAAVRIELKEDLEESEVNCVGFLLGDDPNRLTFRPIFDESVLQGYENEVVVKQRCRLPHFAKVFMGVFEFFNHVSQVGICDKLPVFKTTYDAGAQGLRLGPLPGDLRHGQSIQSPVPDLRPRPGHEAPGRST